MFQSGSNYLRQLQINDIAGDAFSPAISYMYRAFKQKIRKNVVLALRFE